METSIMEIEEIFKRSVSYQKNVWSSITQEINLGKIIKIIKQGELESKISRLRNLKRKNKIEEYNLLKKSLPSVTFCGTFEKTRRVENLKEYNSIVVVDIDKLNPQEVKNVNECLKHENYVFSHWISPSGNGFKGLIKIKQSFSLKKAKTESYHKHAFKELTEYFLKKHSIELDISGSDISRLCFLSSDKNLSFKNFIKPFEVNVTDEILTSAKPHLPKNNQKTFYSPEAKNDARDKRTMIKIIKFLEKRKISITDTYENWYRVAFAIANTFTYDKGERFYLKLCRLDLENHDEMGSINLLQYCYKNTRGDITFKTIVYLANEKGFVIGG